MTPWLRIDCASSSSARLVDLLARLARIGRQQIEVDFGGL